jgi:hypothetical protein
MDAPERLTRTDPESISLQPPSAPALNPVLPDAGLSRILGGYTDPPTSRLVILLGHFDDRRSPLCGPEREQVCRDNFIVDSVAWAYGSTQPISHESRLETADDVRNVPRSTADDVVAAVTSLPRDARILSIGSVVDERLAEMEPALADDPLLAGERIVWLVKAVDDTAGQARLLEYAIRDSDLAAWRIDGSDLARP